MDREEMLGNEGYWLSQIQTELYFAVKSYAYDNNLLSHRELADSLGASLCTVRQIMDGDYNGDLEDFVKILTSLGLYIELKSIKSME